MMFLTVKEAAAKTGKSPSSIRRMIYPILEDDQHADRQHIEPNPDAARTLRLQGENFAWRVSEEFLAREISTKPAVDPVKPKREGIGDEPSMHELLTLLREQLQQSHTQLQVKDQQIATLSEITQSLNERLREGNILMGSLQKQLTIGESAAMNPATIATSVEPEPVKSREAKPATVKKPKPKASLWRQLFS